MECTVCYENKSNFKMYQPCNHLVCKECCDSYKQENSNDCAICGKKYQKVDTIYI